MYATVLKGNPNHVPAGTAAGGQFARSAGSTGGPFGKWETTFNAVVAHVLQGEKDDGFEHAQVFGTEGNVVVTAYGGPHSIDFLPKELSAMLPGMTLVHNHPNGSSLSPQDMLLAGQRKLTVYAVSQSGNKFWSTGFASNVNVMAAFNDVSMRIQKQYIDAVNSGAVNKVEGASVLQHVINLALQKRGIIDYHYSLGKACQAAFDANKAFYEQLISKE